LDKDEPEIAVALRYDRESKIPPYVTAKGRDAIARHIKEIAEAHGVPVRKDADLAQLLNALDINTPIPIPLFAAVAEIIAHLYTTNRDMRDAGTPTGRHSPSTSPTKSTSQGRP
jgi:flagellar biosynthesis protein